MARLSGLQRDVLALYRQCLRAVREKPEGVRDNFRHHARSQFREHIQLDKKDFSTIEYLLRQGRKQLDMYRDPGIKNVSR